MKHSIYTAILFCFTLSVYAQENKLLNELKSVKGVEDKVAYILDRSIENLEKINLMDQLDSELNTISSCLNTFVNSKDLGLNEKDLAKLKERMQQLATECFKSANYLLIKNSGGYAPIFGIGLDTIAQKKVIILYLGGDCILDETDMKTIEIITIFNEKMSALLND